MIMKQKSSHYHQLIDDLSLPRNIWVDMLKISALEEIVDSIEIPNFEGKFVRYMVEVQLNKKMNYDDFCQQLTNSGYYKSDISKFPGPTVDYQLLLNSGQKNELTCFFHNKK